jgi:hypothetical protein
MTVPSDDEESSNEKPLLGGKPEGGGGGDIEANEVRGIDPTNNNSNNNYNDDDDQGFSCNFDCSQCCNTKYKRWGWCGFTFVVIIVSTVLLAGSLKRIDSTQYGLEYHPRKKELEEVAQQGGMHIGPPGYSFVKFPSTYIVSGYMYAHMHTVHAMLNAIIYIRRRTSSFSLSLIVAIRFTVFCVSYLSSIDNE